MPLTDPGWPAQRQVGAKRHTVQSSLGLAEDVVQGKGIFGAAVTNRSQCYRRSLFVLKGTQLVRIFHDNNRGVKGYA